MNQRELNRAVARATGETVDRIERMGFRLLVMPVTTPTTQRKQPILQNHKVRSRRPAATAVCSSF